MLRDNRCMYMAHVCFKSVVGIVWGVCGNVCCVLACLPFKQHEIHRAVTGWSCALLDVETVHESAVAVLVGFNRY